MASSPTNTYINYVPSEELLRKFYGALSSNDYQFSGLVRDPKLFEYAYFFSARGILTETDRFSISLKGRAIHVNAEATIYEAVAIFIEKLRRILCDYLDCFRPAEVYLVKDLADAQNPSIRLFERESNQHDERGFCSPVGPFVLDLSKVRGACPITIYSAFIEPVLPTLAKTCGGSLAVEEVQASLKSSSNPTVEQLAGQMMVYCGPDAYMALRSPYVREKLCDLTLSCADGSFPVHANLVMMRGGMDLQHKALSALNEPNATLHFKHVSSETLKWFVDFLYLEGEGFMDKAKRELNEENRLNLMQFINVNYITPLYPFSQRLAHLAIIPSAEDHIFEKIDYDAMHAALDKHLPGYQPSSE